MSNHRLEFALDQLTYEHWSSFEKFCSEFLVREFPTLRTTASANGDKGRDGELFQTPGQPRVVFQYSVTQDWKSKIKNTLSTLGENFTDIRRLIYCTSRGIPSSGQDELKTRAWADYEVNLDIRDASFFVERSSDSAPQSTASEELCVAVADPKLQERKLLTTIKTPLGREESKIALLQLTLNQRDRETERSITRTSFESLTRAALIDTNADNTRSLREIQSAVQSFLPHADVTQVNDLVSSALSRLAIKRGPITRRSDTGAYHLSFREHETWKEQAADHLLGQQAVEDDLRAGLFGLSGKLDGDSDLLSKEVATLRLVLENMLTRRGEAFALEVGGRGDGEADVDLVELISSMEVQLVISPLQAATALRRLLAGPSEATKAYLTKVLDAYTLFAFLQQTPDVKKTLARIFSEGEVWLDTSAILPLLGEILIEKPSLRSFTNLLKAAKDSGLRLFITNGVIEEVDAHLRRSVLYTQMRGGWVGRVPFLYKAYISSGRGEADFAEWVEDMKGNEQPQLDIQEYLAYHFGVEKKNLTELAGQADIALRGAVQELWQTAHEKRRSLGAGQLTAGSTVRLIDHDVESVVGVIEYRKGQDAAPLGYTAWWLTLDSTAYKLKGWLRDQLGDDAPHSPVLNPDYLSQILRLGPLRRSLPETDLSELPLATRIGSFDDLSTELLDLARETRERFSDFTELRIRREVRDELNRSRSPGSVQSDYAATLETEILDSLH